MRRRSARQRLPATALGPAARRQGRGSGAASFRTTLASPRSPKASRRRAGPSLKLIDPWRFIVAQLTAIPAAKFFAQGRLHQGALRVSRYNPFEGHVGSDAVGADIVVSGREAMNRAFDGALAQR